MAINVPKATTLAILISIIFIWGVNWSIVKMALQDIPPLWLGAANGHWRYLFILLFINSKTIAGPY